MTGYRTCLAGLCGLALSMLLATGSARAGVISYWNGTGSNDSTSWAGLGANGATISSPFAAISTGGNAITGTLASGAGQVAVACPASPCGWTGGFAAGDSLVWALDNTTDLGSGPLTLSFGSAVLAGGLSLQADAPGTFTAQVEAFDGASLLGTESITSDTNGDPVFIGAQDTTTADITSLTFALTGCTGTCDLNDFAVDTLYSINPGTTPPPPPPPPPPPTVPEPASILLFAGALTALGVLKLRRRQRS